MLIASAIVSGLGLGSMYGLLALGFHVTHAVSRTVNFAQGSTMMLGAVLCFTFWVTLGWPLALAVVLALAACALWGVVVERVAVRPFVARGSNSWLIATVALGIVLENVVLFTFGKDPRGMPPGVADDRQHHVSLACAFNMLQILIPVIGLAARRRSAGVLRNVAPRQGAARRGAEQRCRAADGHPRRTRGRGRRSRCPDCSPASPAFWSRRCSPSPPPWARCSASRLSPSPSSAASKAPGAWCWPACIYGVAEALITALLGSTYTQIVTFALVILALAVRPNGLFGRAELRKV